MNVAHVNEIYQHCNNPLIDKMGDVISKESGYESYNASIKSSGKIGAANIKLEEQVRINLGDLESLSHINSTREPKPTDATNGSPKNTVVDESENLLTKPDDNESSCVCNKHCTKSKIVETEQYQLLENLWSELHDIIKGLYESKLNELNVLSCTCCKDGTLSPITKPVEDVSTLPSKEFSDRNNDSKDVSNSATREISFKECGVKSNCGCFDETGFPHHSLRELRNSKCVDARAVFLIEKLCKKNSHQLFQHLEEELHVITMNLHNRLERVMKNHDKDPNIAEVYIKLVIGCYEKLCSASKRVSPLLMQLQRGHLARFSLTWELLNKRFYLHCIHVKVQPLVLGYVSQFRKIQQNERSFRDLVQRYIVLDEEMTLISAMWKDVSIMIEDYNNDHEELHERQMKLDNRYQALLDVGKQKKKKLQSDLKKLTKELGDLRTNETPKRHNRPHPVTNVNTDFQHAYGTQIKNSCEDKTMADNKKDHQNTDCEYTDKCHCCAPELCISEEVIRVLNKETDGTVDGTKITASSTSRGDIVCLPGGGKKISTSLNESSFMKDVAKINMNPDNSETVKNAEVKRKIIRLPDDFPCPCKVDCRHRSRNKEDKMPIHSPTCKNGIKDPTLKPVHSSCPKHSRQKLHNNEWKSSSHSPDLNSKPVVTEHNKPPVHNDGHKCCNGNGETNHTHWTPNSHNKGCACCYCSVYDGAPTSTCSPINRKYNEARERLRGKLKTKALCKSGNNTLTDTAQDLEQDETDSLCNKEHQQLIGLDKDSRDTSSCLSYEDRRNVKDLLEWIEGSNSKVKDPVKKAAKKARQKLKKIKEKEKECPSSKPVEMSNSISTDGMVNIRLLPSDIPRVAVTAVGSSPDKNKLLYTLINGQKVIPGLENTKKDKKKKKQSISTAIDRSPLEVISDVKCKGKLKYSEEKTVRNPKDSSIDKTEVLPSVDTESKNKSASKKNKDSKKGNGKIKKIDEKTNTSIETNNDKIPKCQDKFCQTDEKFYDGYIHNITNDRSHDNVAIEIDITPGKSKIDNKKSNTQQVLKKVVLSKNVAAKSAKSLKQEIPNQKDKKKVDDNISSNSKLKTDNPQKVTKNKKKTVNEPTSESKSAKDTSSEWIEIGNKSRLNNKTNIQLTANNDGNKTTAKIKKSRNKVKENIGKSDCASTVTSTLSNAFGKLQLNSDTTIEVMKNIPIINPIPSPIVRKSTERKGSYSEVTSGSAECSIMDQLNQGVGVDRLKLPPGITLTRVDPAIAYANHQRKFQQVSNSTAPALNGPRKSTMIVANPVLSSATDNNFKPVSTSTSASNSEKSSRKSRRKNKSLPSNSNQASSKLCAKQPKMITLRNPLFQNNNLAKIAPNSGKYVPVQPLPVDNSVPIPKQASITQNKDGMFTIRSPALQHALSTGASNFRPHPYAEISHNTEHFSYFSNSLVQKQDEAVNSIGENLYQNVTMSSNTSLFNNSAKTPPPKFFETNVKNNHETQNENIDNVNRNSPIYGISHFNENDCYGSQLNIQDNAKLALNDDFTKLSDDNLSFFMTPFITPSFHEGGSLPVSPTPHLSNYMNIENIQRLNSQVTIHNISENPCTAYHGNDGSNIEVIKMQSSQQFHGKFGNIGEELTVTRSKFLNDNSQLSQGQLFKGRSIVKHRKDSELVDNIFAPNQTVNLSELESEERDIESFKRFNYYFEPPKNKPKINLNVNDIVVKKKSSGATDTGIGYININDYSSNMQQFQIDNCLHKKS